jgi:hypothetical protein
LLIRTPLLPLFFLIEGNGHLAQLVQSACPTSKRSLVRIQQCPLGDRERRSDGSSLLQREKVEILLRFFAMRSGSAAKLLPLPIHSTGRIWFMQMIQQCPPGNFKIPNHWRPGKFVSTNFIPLIIRPLRKVPIPLPPFSSKREGGTRSPHPLSSKERGPRGEDLHRRRIKGGDHGDAIPLFRSNLAP